MTAEVPSPLSKIIKIGGLKCKAQCSRARLLKKIAQCAELVKSKVPSI